MSSENLLDELADYAAGVLDPQAAAAVRSRLAADPELALLAADLSAAQHRVAGELAGAPDEPMPPAVAARLDALLPTPVEQLTGGTRARAQDEPAALDRSAADRGRPEPGRPAGRGTTGPARGPAAAGSRPGRPRRRWLGGALAGAGALAVAALAVGVLATAPARDSGSGSAGKSNADSAQAPVMGSAVPPILHSATDFDPATLPRAADMALQATGADVGEAANGEALSRLESPAALVDCLTAVTARYPGPVAEVVYARFRGAPALIVVLADRTVVAGPDCGLPGAATDEVFVTPPR
jgi:hypothetical protein